MRSILTRVTVHGPRIVIMGLNYAPEPTGIAPYTTKLAEHLVREGRDVEVLTGYPHYPNWKLQQGYAGWTMVEEVNGVRLKRLRHFIPDQVTNFSRLHLELSFGLRLFLTPWNKPEAILLISPSLFAAALVLLRRRLSHHKPAVGIWVQDVYSRGLEETGTGNSKATAMMKRLEGLVFRSATKVSVIHERFKYYLSSTLEVPSGAVDVIRNWTHIRPQATFDRHAVRTENGWGDDEIVVLHAGNMGVKQALQNVVAAARLADERNSNVRFVLLGDGNQRLPIQQDAIGVERVQFIPPLPDDSFAKVLRSADILLVNEMAGLSEMAVPSKLTSYFSTGLPVIAATEATSTTAGEIRASGGGLRIPPDSPADLLKSAEQLGSNESLSERLGCSGVAYAKSTLSEETAMLQYSKWLNELIRG